MDREESLARRFFWPLTRSGGGFLPWADDVDAPVPYHVVCQECRMCLVDWPGENCPDPLRHNDGPDAHP
jgi:hypothetical protein